MNETPRIALIGCGRIGFLLEKDPLRYKPCTHFGGLKSAGLNVNYACDINRNRLSEFAETAGIPDKNLYIDYKELIKKETPDLIIIATWTESHAEIAEYAIKNNARLIILEKPFTSDLKSASKLIETSEKNGTNIIVNHERRFDSFYRMAGQLVSRGEIGKLKSARASILTGKYKGKSNPEEGGGPLLHDGTHMVDIIRFIIGEIVTVSGRFFRDERDSGFEDHAYATLIADNNTLICLEAGGSRDYFTFELEISGTTGKIVIGNGIKKLFKSAESDFYTGFKDLKEIPFPESEKNNCFTELYIEAINVLNGNSINKTSSEFDGYKALEAIHAVYYSSWKKGKTINLPLDPDEINISKIFGLEK